MTDFLDKLKVEPAEPDALAKINAAVKSELAQKKPVRSWQQQALMLFGASFGVFVVVAIAVLLSGAARSEVLPSKVGTLLPMIAASALCAFAALAPRRRLIRIAAMFSALSAAVLLVVARAGVDRVSPTPEWVCTALHVAAAVVPIFAAVMILRGTAPSPLRAAVAGLAMGTTGAMLGELVCEQGLRHVAIFHLGAWAIVVAACVALSSVVRPRSYAP
jgi:hypothetical protein